MSLIEDLMRDPVSPRVVILTEAGMVASVALLSTVEIGEGIEDAISWVGGNSGGTWEGGLRARVEPQRAREK